MQKNQEIYDIAWLCSAVQCSAECDCEEKHHVCLLVKFRYSEKATKIRPCPHLKVS